jgi:hypothetical protein
MGRGNASTPCAPCACATLPRHLTPAPPQLSDHALSPIREVHRTSLPPTGSGTTNSSCARFSLPPCDRPVSETERHREGEGMSVPSWCCCCAVPRPRYCAASAPAARVPDRPVNHTYTYEGRVRTRSASSAASRSARSRSACCQATQSVPLSASDRTRTHLAGLLLGVALGGSLVVTAAHGNG